MEHIGYRKFLKKVQQRVVPEIGELLPNFPVGTIAQLGLMPVVEEDSRS